ncbi:MAG: hypothetical protein IKK81_01205 [Prevotella sp.]|nr:hypothetical protein [Prevotella sp.]
MEEEKFCVTAAEFSDLMWEKFCQLCAFVDEKTALQWWQYTNDALSSSSQWYKVAGRMKKNIAQLAKDRRKEKAVGGAVSAGTTIINNAHIGQMSGVNEPGSNQVYISSEKDEK